MRFYPKCLISKIFTISLVISSIQPSIVLMMKKEFDLLLFVMIFCYLFFCCTGFVAALYYGNKKLMIGTGLFFVSDTILVFEIFLTIAQPWLTLSSVSLLATYYAAVYLVLTNL